MRRAAVSQRRDSEASRRRLPRLLRVLACAFGLAIAGSTATLAAVPAVDSKVDQWFEAFKREASDEELYRFLYALPKGADLHHHLSGSIIAEWFYDLALAQADHGYRYYTRVRINNCREYGGNAFSETPYLMMFLNIQESTYNGLGFCERSEYVRLEALSDSQKAGWLDSLRLDKPHEGRDEFFQYHWQRMNDLYKNPYLAADALVLNMQEFRKEGLSYMETMVGIAGMVDASGAVLTMDATADIYRQRLLQPDAQAIGMAVRLQVAILRFLPDAEEHLKALYGLVSRNNDLFVGVNMVGREDNDKGHPLRFLDTLRELRLTHHSVRLSIHAGEVDEPNSHVKDTLLLGADRIGHGVNLITDPDTLRLMRHGPYMIEINLVSNLLLEYVSHYGQHPFPEYLRTGIPVALSTDDRGMWDSNMTDEYFVAVKEFNLNWRELIGLARTSLEHAFAPPGLKEALLEDYTKRINDFTAALAQDPTETLSPNAESYSFICDRYQLCDWSTASDAIQ